MRKLFNYLEKIKRMSARDFLHTIYLVYIKPNSTALYRRLHSFSSTLQLTPPQAGSLLPLFTDIKLHPSDSDRKNLAYLCEKYCSHYFDLLGSGWTRNSFSENSFGFMGIKYPELLLERDEHDTWLKDVISKVDIKKARTIYKHITPEYIPIDWQKDIKSGWRWSAKMWSPDIQYGNKAGVDVKLPWELSRLQHLVRLAISYAAEIGDKNRLLKEFTNQTLDFIAQNPPEKGINWRCTMDVGIRAANIALSYSLMKAGGAVFSPFFEKLMAASVYSHCHFIRSNLEWSSSCRSNHYLSDICGLLFGAAILPDSSRKKKWLTFARKEIEKELFLQFHEDGSDFEASVAYHRLSAELIVYSAALINKLAKDGYVSPLGQDCFNRIHKMGLFSHDTVLPDGTLYQCGDNDSGHFFAITPVGDFCTVRQIKGKYENLTEYNALSDDEIYFDENMNCVDGLLNAINGLLDAEIPLSTSVSLEADIILGMCRQPHSFLAEDTARQMQVSAYTGKDLLYRSEHTISLAGHGASNLHHVVYPDFGLTVYRSDDIFLAICWSDNGQNGNAGHTHNDKLSFELWLDGKPYFRDPGTFVYTPFPEWRNKLRSVQSHSVMNSGREQNEYTSLFSMQNESRCRLLELSDTTCSVLLEFNGTVQKRTFSISPDCILIKDESNEPFTVHFEQKYITNGYGKLMKKDR